MERLNRREMIGGSAIALSVAAAVHVLRPSLLSAQATSAGAQQKPPPLDRDLVKDFVVAAHSNLDKVKTMLAEEPGLINATWDWSGGDFETALGGASHMGRADIASVLLANGARLDVFCAAMMGKADVLRACIADNAAIVHVKGPHGISLLRHAQAGKQETIVSLLSAAGAT